MSSPLPRTHKNYNYLQNNYLREWPAISNENLHSSNSSSAMRGIKKKKKKKKNTKMSIREREVIESGPTLPAGEPKRRRRDHKFRGPP